jgi:hypothetical protein
MAIFFSRSFSVDKACQIQCAAQDNNKKLCFFAGEEVGFELRTPTEDGEEDWEEFTRTRVQFLFSFKSVFVRKAL